MCVMIFFRNFILLVSVVLFTTIAASAQDSRSGNPDAIFGENPSSKGAEKAEVKKSKRKKKSLFKRSYNARMDKKVEEFEERMKDNKKKYRKRARKMEKPQYSDPSYFGHKKKPKKRPVGKRKLCKECGIVH